MRTGSRIEAPESWRGAAALGRGGCSTPCSLPVPSPAFARGGRASTGAPSNWPANPSVCQVSPRNQPAGAAAEQAVTRQTVVRSHSAPTATSAQPRPRQERAVLKVEVMPYAQSRSKRVAQSRGLDKPLLQAPPIEFPRPTLVSEVSYVPVVAEPCGCGYIAAAESEQDPTCLIQSPRPTIDGTWSSSRSTLTVPRRPCAISTQDEVTSPYLNSGGSDASTIAVPADPRFRSLLTAKSCQATQTELHEAPPLLEELSTGASVGDSWTWTSMLKAKEALSPEPCFQRDAVFEDSLEDDVRMAEIILRPVSESLEKLRSSIEESTPRFEPEATSYILMDHAECPSPRPSAHVAFATAAEVQEVPTAAPLSPAASSESCLHFCLEEGRVTEVLRKLEDQLDSLEAILSRVEAKRAPSAGLADLNSCTKRAMGSRWSR